MEVGDAVMNDAVASDEIVEETCMAPESMGESLILVPVPKMANVSLREQVKRKQVTCIYLYIYTKTEQVRCVYIYQTRANQMCISIYTYIHTSCVPVLQRSGCPAKAACDFCDYHTLCPTSLRGGTEGMSGALVLDFVWVRWVGSCSNARG